MMKVNSNDVFEIEDFLTQQLDQEARTCKASGYMTHYANLFQGASTEIKRLRKLLKNEAEEL